MVETILDDLDLYSNLLMSVGTHDPNRPFTPIEVSDLIIRLKDETGDSWEELSKRVGLGKKIKNSTVEKKSDTTQVRLFEKLQNLSKKSGYALGWGTSKDGKVAMTIGCDIAKLSDKNEQDIFVNAVLESLETEKPIRKNDVKNILNRKNKSPKTPIEDIIEHVMSIKPKIDLFYKIGISPDDDFLQALNKKAAESKISPTDFLKLIIKKKFFKNEIMSILLSKNNLIWITLDKNNFNTLEKEWKSKKIPVTAFFNQILMEEIKNE